MQNAHLIQVLKQMKNSDIFCFKQWVQSPIANKNKKIIQLNEYILKYGPTYDHPKLTKEAIYKHIYKNEPYQSTRINNLVSDLFTLLLDFLAYQNYQKMSQFQKLCMMDELFKHELPKSMLKIAKRFRKAEQQSTFKHGSHFFEEYLYYKQLDEHFLSKPKRVFDENLQLKSDNLDLFYISTKLKIACDMVSRNKVIQADYDCHFLEEIRLELKKYPERFSSYPAISVYTHILLMLEEGTEERYFNLKNLLQQHLDIFPKEELRVLYDYARNFCIQKINQGNPVYYREILNLYQLLLEEKIIFKNDYLTQWDYKNIVTVAVRLKEFDWTENFIRTYKKHLPPKEQENAFAYNLASFYYEKKEYKKSLRLLYEVRFTDTSYHLGAKIIQLKSYYELDEDDALYALIDAFKIYLLRSKQISEYRKRANLNFIKLAKKIFQLREREGYMSKSAFQQRHEKITQLLTTTTPIANLNWLKIVLHRLVDK